MSIDKYIITDEEIETDFLRMSGILEMTMAEFVEFIHSPANECDYMEWRSLFRFLSDDHWIRGLK